MSSSFVYSFGSIIGDILISIDDCTVDLGLCNGASGVLNGDFVDPLKGELGINGDDDADDEEFEGVELPEFPIVKWKIDFRALLLKIGAVCGVI